MIRCLREYKLEGKLGHVQSIPVSLNPKEEPAVLFVHSAEPGVDPWSESFHFPIDTYKLSLFSGCGKHLWTRDLGLGIVPGVWFAPVMSFDLDGDGIDEIWTVGNNRPAIPMTVDHRVLQRLDPFTGEVTGSWPWKTVRDTVMCKAYRYMLAAGYANGEPVLITAQGTYDDMYLQGWSAGMEKRWDIEYNKDTPGARASHVFPVLDFNGDGVDELFWGERVISVDTGKELFCCDRENFNGHSDIVIPFVDPETGKKYIYTCRENDDLHDIPRVVLFDEHGNTVWTALTIGHMDRGWVAAVGENRRYLAMAMRLQLGLVGQDTHRGQPDVFYYDALTGEPAEFDFPYPGHYLMPVDFNGDGYHEFFGVGGEARGKCFDRKGNVLCDLGGIQVRSGKILDLPGQQIMLYYPEESAVRVYGDDEAGNIPTAPGYEGYHRFMQHLMASGYNNSCGVQSCGM